MSKRAGSTAASSGAKRPKNEEKQLKFDLTCSFVGESDSNSLPPLVVLDGNAAQPHTKVFFRQLVCLSVCACWQLCVLPLILPLLTIFFLSV